MKTPAQSRSEGFDHGNYGSAYESEDWDSWYASHGNPPDDCDPVAYAEGCLLGFFSSFEISEISDPVAAEYVSALRTIHPEYE